jgi:hypothetical protein
MLFLPARGTSLLCLPPFQLTLSLRGDVTTWQHRATLLPRHKRETM